MAIVSFIMGAYNCEKTIEECLNSLINQTFTDWECIICDDCSKDNTFDIISKYGEKDSRFIILKNDVNLKLAASLNNCLKVAKGKYIARVDADDYCHVNRLSEQVEFMENHKEYDVVGTSVIIYDDFGIYGIRNYKEKPEKKDMINGAPFAHPTILIKRDVLEKLGGYISNKNTTRAEDLNLWFRFFYAGYNGYNLQKPLYYYREGLVDYKKRTFKASLQISHVLRDGYKLLRFKKILYYKSLRPIIGAILPDRYMLKRSRKKLIKLD